MDPQQKIPRHVVRSISFDPLAVEWIDRLVVVLKSVGYTRAARSDVVRIAVLELQKTLDRREPLDLLKFVLDRQAERLLGPSLKSAPEPVSD